MDSRNKAAAILQQLSEDKVQVALYVLPEFISSIPETGIKSMLHISQASFLPLLISELGFKWRNRTQVEY